MTDKVTEEIIRMHASAETLQSLRHMLNTNCERMNAGLAARKAYIDSFKQMVDDIMEIRRQARVRAEVADDSDLVIKTFSGAIDAMESKARDYLADWNAAYYSEMGGLKATMMTSSGLGEDIVTLNNKVEALNRMKEEPGLADANPPRSSGTRPEQIPVKRQFKDLAATPPQSQPDDDS